MAYIMLQDNSTRIVTREEGALIWESLQNPANLSEHELDKLSRIKRIWLNHRYAPISYLEDRREVIQKMYGYGAVPINGKEPWYYK